MPDPVLLAGLLRGLGFKSGGKDSAWNAAMAMQDMHPRQIQAFAREKQRQSLEQQQMALKEREQSAQEQYLPWQHILNPMAGRQAQMGIAEMQNETARANQEAQNEYRKQRLGVDRAEAEAAAEYKRQKALMDMLGMRQRGEIAAANRQSREGIAEQQMQAQMQRHLTPQAQRPPQAPREKDFYDKIVKLSQAIRAQTPDSFTQASMSPEQRKAAEARLAPLRQQLDMLLQQAQAAQAQPAPAQPASPQAIPGGAPPTPPAQELEAAVMYLMQNEGMTQPEAEAEALRRYQMSLQGP